MMPENDYQYRADWDAIYKLDDPKPWEQDVIEPALKAFFGNPDNIEQYKNCRILDVGCGNGRICKYLLDLGYKNVFGLDVSVYKKTEFSKKTEGRIQYVCKDIVNDDISEFTVEEKRFDIVICWFLLHHILKEDVYKFIINLFNICQTNGFIILSFRLPTNNNHQADSHFSKLHRIQLYDLKEVEEMMAPYFENVRKREKDKKLLKEPDGYGDVYPYCVLRLIKTKKTHLSGIINAFKEMFVFSKNIINKDSNDSNQVLELKALLNVLNEFYAVARTAEDLSESDYTDLFKSLFRNVSRIVCKWLRNKGLGDNDAVILKMDTNTSVYSVSKYGTDSRPHCKFNREENHCVESRAYELFYKYKDYLDHSKLEEDKKITIIDYFSKHPDTKFIEYFRKENTENQIQQSTIPQKNEFDLNRYEDYKSFLEALFFDISNKKVPINHIVNYCDYDSFMEFVCDYGVKSDSLAKSFSAFNLGIPGFESWGVLIIEGCDSDYSTVEKWFYQDEKETKLLLDIKNIFFILQKIDYDYHESISKKKIRLETVKSAKAAIMSRNMSHNIGSHVMAYLKQQLGSASSISDGRVLANLIPDNVNYDSDQIEEIGLPFLVGLGRFIGYLQERQDYIATISTDHIPYSVPVNLKDAIYDELNPDLRYLRHRQESYNEAKNRPANILLNYIAKSEGLSRENMDDGFHSEKDIRFGFIAYDNQKGGYNTFGLDSTDVKTNDVFASNNEALSQMRKINFSLPGGLVGRQAVFSIIENLIRNAAKHGDTSSVKNLDFTLDIIDGSKIRKEKEHKGVVGDWNEGKRVNEEIWRELYEKADDLDDIYLLTITDNLPCSGGTVKDLKKGLYEDFVDSNSGQMTTANKGLKEIRISAAWIRGETDESRYLKYPTKDYDNNEKPVPKSAEYQDRDFNNTTKKKAPLVAVERSAEGHLRYIVCIPKNKIVAVVSEVKKDDGTTIASFDKELLEKFDELHEQNKDRWTILTDEELKYSKTSFSFILCPDDDDAFKTLRPFTSNRLCRWKVNDESNGVLLASNKDNDNETMLYIYRLFTGISDESDCVFIADDRARSSDAERERTSGKKHFEKIRFDSIDDADVSHKYLYSTHYSTKRDFIEFYVNNIEKGKTFDCIESVTGDNSSDRLIRRERLDKIWYYTHLYAMQKKVAIIDERIFKSVHCIDENRFVGDKTISVMDLKQFSSQISIKDLKKKIRPLLSREGKEALIKARTIDDVALIVEEIPRRFISKNELYEDKTVIGSSHLTPYYHGKAVDIFTVVKNAEGKMALAGCLNGNTKFDVEKNDFCNVFKILATFESDAKGGFELKPVSDEYDKVFADRYDYISIHQGILDKIYDNLNIKKNETAMCQLTECIHNKLMIDKSTCGKYLPRFIIHSGRAKPPKNDMPQEQPFVQYAAIENAVKDCKSVLVELLDFAKYEPANC